MTHSFIKASTDVLNPFIWSILHMAVTSLVAAVAPRTVKIINNGLRERG